MKIGEIKEEDIGKFQSDVGENDDEVSNWLGYKYKHERQQLILSPHLFEINIWVDSTKKKMVLEWIEE